LEEKETNKANTERYFEDSMDEREKNAKKLALFF
jgi:hypothetical protein